MMYDGICPNAKLRQVVTIYKEAASLKFGPRVPFIYNKFIRLYNKIHRVPGESPELYRLVPPIPDGSRLTFNVFGRKYQHHSVCGMGLLCLAAGFSGSVETASKPFL